MFHGDLSNCANLGHGVVAHTCNSSAGKVEEAEGRPWLHSKVKANLG